MKKDEILGKAIDDVIELVNKKNLEYQDSRELGFYMSAFFAGLSKELIDGIGIEHTERMFEIAKRELNNRVEH